MNRVILMGRLVNNPEFSVGQTGTPYCRFRIAVDRSFTRQGEQRQSDFFSITCFGKTAEFVNRFFVQGKPILIEGRIENDNYTDKNGVQRYEQRIMADRAEFVLSDNTRTGDGGGYYNNNYNNGGNNGYGYNGGYPNNYNNNNYYGNAGNNGGYNGSQNGNGNGYGYNGGNDYPAGANAYQQPAQQNPASQQPAEENPSRDVQLGNSDINDFEEILSDGQVPF